MGWLVIARVQKTTVGSSSAKSLLLALASYADNDGQRCFPGQVVLSQTTELSLDTIQRQLKYLIERGFVSAQKRRRKGRWASWDYKINLSALADLSTRGSRDQAASCGSGDDGQAALHGVDQAVNCGSAGPHRAASSSRTVRLYPSKDTSKLVKRETAPETRIPDPFRLDDRTYAWALERLGGEPKRVERSVRRFVDNARDKGFISCDWMAKVRMWIDNDGDRPWPRRLNDLDAGGDSLRQSTASAMPSDKEWNDVLATYLKTGYWTRHLKVFGPDPTSPACRVPLHLLVKYGLSLASIPQTAE